MISNILKILLNSSNVNPGVAALIAILLFIFGVPVGYVIGKIVINKKNKEAKNQAENIIESAKKEAENLRKVGLLEIKEERSRTKLEQDKEFKEQKNELQKKEQRIDQREESLNEKERYLDKKAYSQEQEKRDLNSREERIAIREKELDEKHASIIVEIEKAARMTIDEAREEIKDRLLADVQHDVYNKALEIEKEAKEQAEKKANEIIISTIQRCNVDTTADISVTVVNTPDDEIKGKLIGRAGRNIRALENAIGVDVIIDDTPNVIAISSFDPVRREIGKRVINKLVKDGKINPSKIEEIVKKTSQEIDAEMKELAEVALYDAGINGVNPEFIKIIGRMAYRTSYGQNMLKHATEVASIAGMLATQLGANEQISRRGGFFHDIGKALDHEYVGTHVEIGVELAKKFKESAAVVHCIQAHHDDVKPSTMEAIIVKIADSISGSRPGARRESMENYTKRLENLEKIADSKKGVQKSFAIQAGREIRVMVKPEELDDQQCYFLAKEIAKEIEDTMEYPGQVKVNVIRESRYTETAK